MTYEQPNDELTEVRNMSAINNALSFLINELIPEGEAREWAKAKRDEILSDISPEVLWAQLEDGSYAMDKDYLGGFLLIIQEEVRNCQTLRKQQRMIGELSLSLQTRFPAAKLLGGERGAEYQRAFLNGALAIVDHSIDAELIERDIGNSLTKQ